MTTTQHIVTVTPGKPLDLGNGETLHRAIADCNLCGCVASGAAKVVIQVACEHATP